MANVDISVLHKVSCVSKVGSGWLGGSRSGSEEIVVGQRISTNQDKTGESLNSGRYHTKRRVDDQMRIM